MVDILTLETGQHALLSVKEGLRQELVLAPTQLLHMEEIIVLETALKPENATFKLAQV